VKPLPNVNEPLTQAELKALHAALDKPGGLNVYATMGVFSAVVSAPSVFPPSGWLPLILGERMISGPDDPLIGLILRFYNNISVQFSKGRVTCPPASEGQQIADFCHGYLEIVDRDQAWIDNEDAMQAISSIVLLAGQQLAERAGAQDQDAAALEEVSEWRQAAREDLAEILLETFDILAPARNAVDSAGRGTVTRQDPKVGRNDPCPCGSGKKYKKCCANN